jgi:hypothetical protein
MNAIKSSRAISHVSIEEAVPVSKMLVFSSALMWLIVPDGFIASYHVHRIFIIKRNVIQETTELVPSLYFSTQQCSKFTVLNRDNISSIPVSHIMHITVFTDNFP